VSSELQYRKKMFPEVNNITCRKPEIY